MFNSVMRLCAVLLLASSVVPNVSADSGGTRAIFIGPVFQISSISADDAGGIYNGSTVTISVTVHNAGAGAGQWQATLSIPDGYDFIESNPCGGDFYSQIGRPAQPKSLSGTYLVWPHGTDGNGSGDTILDLGKVMPVSGTLDEKSEVVMGMNIGQQKQTMDMKMNINVAIESK